MKKLLSVVLAAMLLLTATVALAEQGVAYGVYSMEGEAMDSLIRATVDMDGDKITAVDFDEKLVPIAFGGAEGWAQVDADTIAKLGSAVVTVNDKAYPASVAIDGIVWTIGEDLSMTSEKGEFVAYVCTNEGGDWYFAQESADLLNDAGEVACTVAIGTKESIEHGVHFWMSDLLFPGNIAALEAFVVDNGVAYTLEDMALGENGWTVADVATGATLAGTPNYLLLAQKAVANAK